MNSITEPKKTEIHEIDYCNVKLSISGSFIPSEPRTWDYPGDPEKFELEEVFVEETSIVGILGSREIDDIEQIVLEKYYR